MTKILSLLLSLVTGLVVIQFVKILYQRQGQDLTNGFVLGNHILRSEAL